MADQQSEIILPKIFNLIMLPATCGDCIIIQYGEGNSIRNILIDGGTGGTVKYITNFISELPIENRHFELVIVTHVDRDHIEGIINLLDVPELGFTISDFWFNGYKHLVRNEVEEFGPTMGEKLSTLLLDQKLHWNHAVGGNAIVIEDDGQIPYITLKDGMKIFVLSPYRAQLDKLKNTWETVLLEAGLKPSHVTENLESDTSLEQFGTEGIDVEALNSKEIKEDSSIANGSSIAVLLEFNNKRVLLSGDAHPKSILNSLRLALTENKRIDLLKLSHHGSSKSTSKILLDHIDCRRFAISTNSNRHPSNETIAWIICRKENAELWFNYRTDHNSIWDDDVLKLCYPYSTHYPDGEGICIPIE